MALNDRQQEILALARRHGFVAIDELAQDFEVTPQTVRRDINRLCDQRLLRRYHGGAGLPSSVENLAYRTRRVLMAEEKERLARRLATQIPNDASLFINIGTTTEAVARALIDHRGLRVVTNNLNVAVTLSRNPDFEVIVTGGVVRGRDQGIIGEAAVDFIRQFRLDYGIVGISAIDADGTLLDFDYQEVRVAKAIMENSRRVFLAADYTKFQRSAIVRLGNIVEVAAFFTDRPPPAPIAAMLRAAGVALHVAERALGAVKAG
jgi:DeoR family transcriptional regulator, glycerol-3-phosphate regulon repressor